MFSNKKTKRSSIEYSSKDTTLKVSNSASENVVQRKIAYLLTFLPSELTYIKRASMFLCQRREVRRDAERTEKLEKAPHKTLTICTYLTPETRPTLLLCRLTETFKHAIKKNKLRTRYLSLPTSHNGKQNTILSCA